MKLNIDILACPLCKNGLVEKSHKFYCENTICFHHKSSFPQIINNKPILIDSNNSLLNIETLINTSAISLVKRGERFNFLTRTIRRLLNGSNKVTKSNVKLIIEELNKIQDSKILIIGGGTIGAGMNALYETYTSNIISFDVYDSNNIDLIADAHSLPFKNDKFDLIVIQAVIEHVFDPIQVVSECFRVLKPNALIYAETPFLQHVHEGAFDFTRYTNLGHRILFNKFKKIKSGYIGGLGQSFLWSLEYLISGIFRSRIAGKITKIIFFWIRWVEFIIPSSWNSDGACGNYFIGKKVSEQVYFLNNEIISEYDGAQN
jgi:SAM-dependent methyltransferase